MKKGAVICEFVNLCISPFFDCEKILKLENKRIYYIYILYIYTFEHCKLDLAKTEFTNSQIHTFIFAHVLKNS